MIFKHVVYIEGVLLIGVLALTGCSSPKYNFETPQSLPIPKMCNPHRNYFYFNNCME